jgi:hypothetical protein
MDLKISSPCPMRWESLAGDDRIRYCGRCRLNVYNLAEMSRDEVEGIVRTTRGRLCGRLYLRGDRTATLRDCPGGRGRLVGRGIRKAAIGIGVLVFALICRSFERPDFSDFPQWVRDIAAWIDPQAPRGGGFVVGRLPCPPPAPPPVLPPAPPQAGGN